ncbi:MAG TPA: PE domain-containing protein [Stellaceae bacterium]|jgi:ElaB/YqjD/DUF883 family membrane-anchored ribosome-binding protein
MASDTANADNDLEKIVDDIQALKKDLARLMEHVKSGASDTVSEEASRLYGTIASEGQRQAAALAQAVEEKPLASLLIAFAVGFVSSRILLR